MKTLGPESKIGVKKPVEASIFLSALVFNCYGAIIRLKKSFSDSCQIQFF